MPARRLCLILFGPPGSGKGTQAKFLKQSLRVAHISTGDMLRERVASGDSLGVRVAGLMQSGGLVPDEVVNEMVDDRIKFPDCSNGFILDGYPRTVSQAKLLAGLIEREHVRLVVVRLLVDYNVIMARLSERRQCPTCGALYSVTSNSSEICDYDGSRLVVRNDDQEHVVRDRLRAYEQQTVPVLTTLREAGYPLFEVVGSDSSPQSIAHRIEHLVAEGSGEAA